MVKAWLAAAEEDLLAADLMLNGPMLSYRLVSFHAQQAAEKSLKVLLIQHQVEFGRTHNLGELLRLAEPVAPGVDQTLSEARALTPYAVKARYPSEEPPPDRGEAGRHLALARKVSEHIRVLLKPYLDAGRPGG